MTALIRGGAFEDFEEHRSTALSRYRLLSDLSPLERQTVATLMERHIDVDDWVRFVRAISDESKYEVIKEKEEVKVPNSRRRPKVRELLREYDQSDMFDTKAQKIAWEHHYLGVSLSGSEADIYKADNTCVELIKTGYPNMPFNIAVCVDAIREIITKKGDPMAFVTGRDRTYVMDNIVVFPKVFDRSRRLLEEGNIIKIAGKMDDRGSLIANKIERV